FSSRRRHTRLQGDWSSDVCSSDLGRAGRYILVADHQNPMTQSLDCRLKVLNSIHDKGPGSSALQGRLGNTMHVRVIPKESWRLIRRKRQIVLESLPGIDE